MLCQRYMVSPEYRAVSQDEIDEALIDGEASPQDGPFRQQRYVTICECINAWFVYFRLHDKCQQSIQTKYCICECIDVGYLDYLDIWVLILILLMLDVVVIIAF